MSNSFRILTLSGFLLVTILGTSNAYAVQLFNLTFDSSIREPRSNCLEVFDPDHNRNSLFSGRCEASFSQEWNWEGLAIQGIGTNGVANCVDVFGGQTAEGTRVQLFPCNGTGAQQWKYDNGEIINVRSGKCLAVVEGTALSEAGISTCNNRSAGQIWFIR